MSSSILNDFGQAPGGLSALDLSLHVVHGGPVSKVIFATDPNVDLERREGLNISICSCVCVCKR